jgi:hypothetical protein
MMLGIMATTVQTINADTAELVATTLLCGMVRNGIPRVFCSAEQPEFRRNKPIAPSIPSSAE